MLIVKEDIIKDEELAQLKPEGGRTIDISDFVTLTSIDPIYFDRSYYLVPGEGGAKAYKLLIDAMSKTKALAVAQMVMRQKQYLVAIQAVDDEALLLHTMHYADEVQGIEEIRDDLPKGVKTNTKEVAAAEQLIKSMSGEFDPTQYKDEYREQMRELIESKAEGEGPREVADEDDEDIPPTFDLMAALKKSVEQRAGKAVSKAAKKKIKSRRKSA